MWMCTIRFLQSVAIVFLSSQLISEIVKIQS